MTYTADQLRSALYQEHVFFHHEDDSLMHPDDYMQQLASMSSFELIAETDVDDNDDLDFYMSCWLPA
jgi:hypothetical protein